jgi:hypothetical protein
MFPLSKRTDVHAVSSTRTLAPGDTFTGFGLVVPELQSAVMMVSGLNDVAEAGVDALATGAPRPTLVPIRTSNATNEPIVDRDTDPPG